MEYFLLIFLWVVWCFVHSGMISQSFNAMMKTNLGSSYKYYRLVFNVIALATLVPVYLYGLSMKGDVIISWNGNLAIVRYLLMFFSMFFFLAGAMKYDLLQFLGIRQILSGNSHMSLSSTDSLDTLGILNITRHPWYLAALLLIWVIPQKFYLSTIIVRIVLSAYLVVGTLLEERKLKKEYGENYEKYKNRVSMLFPTKWLISRITQHIRK